MFEWYFNNEIAVWIAILVFLPFISIWMNCYKNYKETQQAKREADDITSLKIAFRTGYTAINSSALIMPTTIRYIGKSPRLLAVKEMGLDAAKEIYKLKNALEKAYKERDQANRDVAEMAQRLQTFDAFTRLHFTQWQDFNEKKIPALRPYDV